MKMSMFTAAFGPALNPSVYTPQCTSSSTIPSSSNAQTMIPTNNDLQQELTQNYENARRQLTDEWRSIEPKLLKIAIQSFEPAIKKCCICLDDFNDILRCNDCSLPSYYCKSCWAYTHKRLWDHMPDIFKVSRQHVERFKLVLVGFENIKKIFFLYCTRLMPRLIPVPKTKQLRGKFGVFWVKDSDYVDV